MKPGGLAVVTGATGGVGSSIARRLSQDGFDLLLSGRNKEALSALAAELRTGRCTIHLDVGQLQDAADASRIALATRSLAAVSVLVNASGMFGPIGMPSDTSPYDLQLTLSVNVIGPMCLSQLTAHDMIKAGQGRIVNVSSAQALHPPDPTVAAYATSKVALNFATRCLAAELEGSEVSACVIHPGNVMTSMWEDIERRARDAGSSASGLLRWADQVRYTGGDSPQAAATLVAKIVDGGAAWSNGRFLAIEGGFDHHPPVGW